MKDLNNEVFAGLFKDAYQKCFGFPLTAPLSETESRHFANKIFEDTGLVIGAKSIKNYSFFIINIPDAKQENPSVATLDTLARYVLNAPYTDEIKRKDKEAHYPYWFQYKSNFTISGQKEYAEKQPANDKQQLPRKSARNKTVLFIAAFIIVASILLLKFFYTEEPDNKYFAEDFHSVAEDSLKNHGWFLKDQDEQWWNKRNEMPSHLT